MIFGLKYLPKISKQIMHCGSVVKNPPVNAGDARDAGSIPGSRRSPRVGNGNPVQYSFFFFFTLQYCIGSSILAWKVPWREESGGLQSMWSHRAGHGRVLMHAYMQAKEMK